MEDYKKKYEEKLSKAKALHNMASETFHDDIRMILEELFDELKESEDERMRKDLINYFGEHKPLEHKEKDVVVWLEKQSKKVDAIENFDTEFEKQVSYLIASAINKEHEYNQNYVKWTANALLNYAKHELEKQGEQKLVNKVKPKFKVGDYIINEHGFVMQIDGINSNTYIYHVLDNTHKKLTYDITKSDKSCHLWTIKDAKDGDIVASHKIIILFKKFQENGSNCSYVIAYGGIDIFGKLHITDEEWMASNDTKPASKEQRDILFSKMKKAGYEWDSEKKELKKIEQKPAWSEEDEKMLDKLIKHFSWDDSIGFTKCECNEAQDWLKSIKEKI